MIVFVMYLLFFAFGRESYTSIIPLPWRVKSTSLLSTWVTLFWRVLVFLGPSSADYIAERMPRVTIEDFNGGEKRRQQLSVQSNQRRRRVTGGLYQKLKPGGEQQ